MAVQREKVTFVIQGEEVNVEVDPSWPTGEDVRLALKESGIVGDPGEWKARTVDGRILDGGKSLIDEGVDRTTRLYLNRGPGRGG